MAEDTKDGKMSAWKRLFSGKYAYAIFILAAACIVLIGTNPSLSVGKVKEVLTEDYTTQLETRLKAILESMDGVGRVNVLITTKEATTKDKRGDTVILKDATPAIEGVVIVAEGTGNADIRKAVFDAVTAALDVKPHKIFVYTIAREPIAREREKTKGGQQ